MTRSGQEPIRGAGVFDPHEAAAAPVRRVASWWPVALSGLLVALALLLVWQRLRVVQLGYVLNTVVKLEERLKKENSELRLELGTLTAPDRMEAMARQRLGLKDPEARQVVVVP